MKKKNQKTSKANTGVVNTKKKKKGCFEGADHCENTLAEIP